jgi:hypothetical protein
MLFCAACILAYFATLYLITHHTTKIYGGMEVKLHAYVASTLHGIIIFMLQALYSWEKWIAVWANLNICPSWKLNPIKWSL